MFGYILPRRGDLRVKELEYYRAVYCGICREEKKLSHRLPAMLSYDSVLLALCRIGVAEESSCFKKRRCASHPISKTLCVVDSPALAYTAAAMALLVKGKLADDRKDESGIKRLAACIAAGGAKRAVKKITFPAGEKRSPAGQSGVFRGDFTPLSKTVEEKLTELAAMEACNEPSVYAGASCFGELLGAVFAFDPVSMTETATVPPDASGDVSADMSPDTHTFFSTGADPVRNTVDDSIGDTVENPVKDTVKDPPPAPALPPLTHAQALCLREIGYRVGRVIFILDAVADLAQDKKEGKYNPLSAAGVDPEDPDFRRDMAAALMPELSAAEGALDLLSLKDRGIESILRNILTVGLADVITAVVVRSEKFQFRRKKEALPHE